MWRHIPRTSIAYLFYLAREMDQIRAAIAALDVVAWRLPVRDGKRALRGLRLELGSELAEFERVIDPMHPQHGPRDDTIPPDFASAYWRSMGAKA